MMMRSKFIGEGFNNYEKSSLKTLAGIGYPVLGTSALLLLNTFNLFGFPVFLVWAYLIKVGSEACPAHLIWYYLLYLFYYKV